MSDKWLDEAIEVAKKMREKTLVNAKNALLDSITGKANKSPFNRGAPYIPAIMRVETFVLAGNIGQALHHFNDKINSNEYQYLSRPHQLIGLNQTTIKIIKVGTWYEREDLDEIHFLLLSYDGHEGILMADSWIPDHDILIRLDKLVNRALQLYNHDYILRAQNIREIYVEYGYIEKRRANHLYDELKNEIRNKNN